MTALPAVTAGTTRPISATDRYITPLKPWAELASFIGTTVVVFIGIYGAKQVRMLKHDIRSRNRRAANEATLDYCERFARFVLLRRQFVRRCEELKLPLFKGFVPKGDAATFADITLRNNCREAVELKMKENVGVEATNLLELISMAFNEGIAVADDEKGFNTIGISYCSIVASHYDIFTVRAESNLYQHVRELYCRWSNRLEIEEIKANRDLLDERLRISPDRRVTPIGMEGSWAGAEPPDPSI